MADKAEKKIRLRAARLSKRTVIAIEGFEAIEFTNDLTTNDIARLESESERNSKEAQSTAFLTAQGTLQQFSLAVRTPHGLLLECDRACLDAFAETLWKARLGRAVSFRWQKETQVIGLFPENARQQARTEASVTRSSSTLALTGWQHEKYADNANDTEGYLFADPRKPLAAMRLWHNRADDWVEAADLTWAEEEDYEAYRLSLGVVERAEEWEGAANAAKKHALPFAFGLDELGALDWQKDCYVGQEITARLKYRARMPKKHALPVRLQGGKHAVHAGDKVFGLAKEGGETLCGEVLYAVATRKQTILLVLFQLASLRLAPPQEEDAPLSVKGKIAAEEKLVVLCASGKRLQGELLLPSWLAGLWQARKHQTQQDG